MKAYSEHWTVTRVRGFLQLRSPQTFRTVFRILLLPSVRSVISILVSRRTLDGAVIFATRSVIPGEQSRQFALRIAGGLWSGHQNSSIHG
jgi:hypothetical protein